MMIPILFLLLTPAMAEQLEVLFSLSSFSRQTIMPRGSQTEALLLALRTCFSDVPLARARLVLQVFSETWGEFVDAPHDLSLQGRLKLRAVPAPQKISLESGSTMFFCCDMQERFRPVVKHFADITAVAQRLLRGAAVLGIPVVATEQYPKGLGSTVEELDLGSARMVLPKTQFSMLLPDVLTLLQNSPNISSIVLFGLEIPHLQFPHGQDRATGPTCAFNKQPWICCHVVMLFTLSLMHHPHGVLQTDIWLCSV
uniref:isochorismatase domain-containing protein 1 isoform X6 n=1 Tax=Myxine glutinosa TaxID=7769 RepID=UPI00358FE0D2